MPILPTMLIATAPRAASTSALARRLARGAAVLGVAAILLGGCATIDKHALSWRSLGVYKIDINQGNYLAQDQVDHLKVGMTPQQVRLALGTPLIEYPFTADRWDYVYEYSHQGVVREHRKLTVWFDDGKLARWEGDRMPQTVVDLNRSASAKALPTNDGKSWWQKLLDRKSAPGSGK